MATNPVTITPSTSVVLINTADYVTNPIVLLPPIDAVGRIITIRDNDGGALTKPITISTTSGAQFQPELSSIMLSSFTINQPYGFLTITPRYFDLSGILNYGLMNVFAFPDASPVATVNTLDANTGYFSTINAGAINASLNLNVQGNTTISGNVIASTIATGRVNTTSLSTSIVTAAQIATSSIVTSTVGVQSLTAADGLFSSITASTGTGIFTIPNSSSWLAGGFDSNCFTFGNPDGYAGAQIGTDSNFFGLRSFSKTGTSNYSTAVVMKHGQVGINIDPAAIGTTLGSIYNLNVGGACRLSNDGSLATGNQGIGMRVDASANYSDYVFLNGPSATRNYSYTNYGINTINQGFFQSEGGSSNNWIEVTKSGYTPSTLSFLTGTGLTSQSRLFINSAGSVGIGTTAPGELLTVNGGNIVATANNGTIGLNPSGDLSGNVISYGGTGANANKLLFLGSTNIEYMRIDNGRVGIGRTAPSYTLDVSGNTRIGWTGQDLPLTITGGVAATQRIQVQGSDGQNATWRIGTPALSTVGIGGGLSQNLSLGFYGATNNNFTEVMRIDTSFNRMAMNIGGRVPLYTVDISGDLGTTRNISTAGIGLQAGTVTNPAVSFGNVDASGARAGLYYASTATLGLTTGGAERLRVDPLGNVGIGRAALAAYRLDVSGTGHFSGNVQMDALLNISGSLVAPSTITGRLLTSTISTGSITTSSIASGTLLTSSIVANTVDISNIATSSIRGVIAQFSSIGGGALTASTITTSTIAANTISTNTVNSGSINVTALSTATVTASTIVGTTITTPALNVAAISTGQVLTSTLTASAGVTAAALSALTVSSGQVTTSTLATNTISTGQITAALLNISTISTASLSLVNLSTTNFAAATISTGQVFTGAITTSSIGATVVTAGTVNIGTLSTAVISLPGGSAAAPTITYNGDSNTGIYSPAIDTVAVTTAGREVIRFMSSGNIGIGTSTPAYILDISGDVRISGLLTATLVGGGGGGGGSSSTINAIAGTDTAPSIGFGGVIDGQGSRTGLYYPTVGSIGVTTAGRERVRFDASGNVGIGISTPQASLEIAGNTKVGTAIGNANILSRWIVSGQNTSTGSVTILTSDDAGVSWTGRTTPFTDVTYGPSFGLTQRAICYAVAYNGSTWIAGGIGTAQMAISTNGGLTWTDAGGPFTNTTLRASLSQIGFCRSVAWNGSMWLAGGHSGDNAVNIARSTNGTSWIGSLITGLSPASGIFSVVWNGSYWIAADKLGAVARSTDGITWSAAVSTGLTQLNQIAASGSLWVAVGVGSGTSQISISSNGITWTVVAPVNPIFGAGGVGSSVAWNGSYWLAGGTRSGTIGACVSFSTDGITWYDVNNAIGADTIGNTCYAIGWNGASWVIAGNNVGPVIATSLTGFSNTWTSRTVPPSSITAGDGFGIGYSVSSVADLQLNNLGFYSNQAASYFSSNNTVLANPTSLVVNNSVIFDRSTGRVGVGTLGPQYTLDVTGTIRATSSIVLADGSTTNPSINFGVGSGADTDTGFFHPADGQIGIVANGNQVVRITGGSRVGIGTTNPGYQLQLGTDSAAKPGTTTWTVASDKRIKKDIIQADLERCYENVKHIPLKKYTWRDDVYSTEQVGDRSRLGWIAQDVEVRFPKAVSRREAFGYEDCRDLNVDQIYASLYGATQRLIQITESMQSTIVGQSEEIALLKK